MNYLKRRKLKVSPWPSQSPDLTISGFKELLLFKAVKRNKTDGWTGQGVWTEG